MGIVDKPYVLEKSKSLVVSGGKSDSGSDLMNNAPTLRWRSIFQAIKDAAIKNGLPGQPTVIYTSEEPTVSSITGSRVKKNAFRYMVPGTWALKSSKIYEDGVFIKSVLEAQYVALPQIDPNEIIVLPGSRGPR